MSENENETESAGQAAKPSRLRGLLMCVIVGVIAGAAGFAVPYLLAASKAPEGKDGTPAPAGQPAFVAFGETVVNLDEGKLNRYLRVAITLQVDKSDEEAMTKELEKNKAILKNWLLSYLSDKTMDEIRGAAGQNRLRREIQDYFNNVVSQDGEDRIHDILFEDFNVQ